MRAFWQAWFILLSFILATLARVTSPGNSTGFVCRPFGACEPCPEDALHEPFCQPFGNRRLMHCTLSANHTARPSLTSTSSPSLHQSTAAHYISQHPEVGPHQGEMPAWESCGRIVEKERADFFEFFACNFVIAAVALLVLFARSKRLQAMHARQLAARIGLVRGVPGGWVNG